MDGINPWESISNSFPSYLPVLDCLLVCLSAAGKPHQDAINDNDVKVHYHKSGDTGAHQLPQVFETILGFLQS